MKPDVMLFYVICAQIKVTSQHQSCLFPVQMRARWATSPPQTAWTGGAPAVTQAKIQRDRGPSASPPTPRHPGSAQRDGGQDRGPWWPGGRARTQANSPERAPGRRGGPAAPCRRKKPQSLRSATAASTGGASETNCIQVLIPPVVRVSDCLSVCPRSTVSERRTNRETRRSSQTESTVRKHMVPSAPARSTAALTPSARTHSEDPGLVSVIQSVHLLADVRAMSSLKTHIRRFWVRSHQMEKNAELY